MDQYQRGQAGCCAGLVSLLLVTECQMGPKVMKVGHGQYSACARGRSLGDVKGD